MEVIKNPQIKVTDIRQTAGYARYLKTLGWTVARIENINYFIKKLPLGGSILKVQRPKKLNFGIIDKLCRKYGVFQIIIEPDLNSTSTNDIFLLKTHGYKLSRSPYLPTKTLRIDLTRPIAQITASYQKDARSAIKKGSGFFIKEYSSPSEIKIFRQAWKKSVKLSRYVPPLTQLINLRKSFKPFYPIILVSHNKSGNILGGAIFTRSLHNCGYYWQAFTNQKGRASLSQYSLLHYGILWAKKQGCRTFDFEGIYDERFPNKSWLGFSHFKKSFGGQEILYPGCYTKFQFPYLRKLSYKKYS